MPKVVVPVRDELLGAAQRRKEMAGGQEVAGILGDLIELGFERRFQELHRQFAAGEIAFGHFAQELGLSVRDLYASLEERGLPTSNVGARPRP